MESIWIEPRFHGPPDSGNSGYTCGRLAAFIDEPATVRLRIPPPLGRELRVDREDTGRVQLLDGTTLVAEAWSATVDLSIPVPPTFAAAESAGQRFRASKITTTPLALFADPSAKPATAFASSRGPLSRANNRLPPRTLALASGMRVPPRMAMSLFGPRFFGPRSTARVPSHSENPRTPLSC